jgi:enamine deaminase RidA (YjgF/YER057c/UK114 family)
MSAAPTRYLSGAPNEEIFGFCQGMRHSDLVWVAGQVGKDNSTGEMDGPTEFANRLRRTVANIREAATELLGEEAELLYTQAHVAMPLGEVWDDLAAGHRALLGEAPASAVLTVDSLAQPDYLVEVSAMAAVGEVERIEDTGPTGAPLGASRAVRAGDLVFLGGHTAAGEDGVPVGATAAEQLDGAARSLGGTLAEMGGSLADCVAVNVWVVGEPGSPEVGDISAANRAHFGAEKPTSTLVFVPELPLGALVQLSATAVLPA